MFAPIENALKKVFGSSTERQVKKVQPIVDAINATGTPNATEAPAPPDPSLAAAVDRWRDHLGTSPALAAVVALLERALEQAEMTRRLLDALRDPTAPEPADPFLARAVRSFRGG